MAIRRASSAAANTRARQGPRGKRRMASRAVAAQSRADMRRFRLAMESSADLIALIDRQTMRYIDVNSAVCKQLGYSKAELLHMGPPDVMLESVEELARAYDA